MKIYTKTGDKGKTSIIGGKRLAKNHIRIEAYGTVDELIAFAGLIRDHLELEPLKEDLVNIQDQLMICASMLAVENDNNESELPKLSSEGIVWLENKIDVMEESLKPLQNFILPGGKPVISFVHVARTVCRRAERSIISLAETTEVPDVILQYFNRLSDYFFVLARYLTYKLGAEEIPWKQGFV